VKLWIKKGDKADKKNLKDKYVKNQLKQNSVPRFCQSCTAKLLFPVHIWTLAHRLWRLISSCTQIYVSNKVIISKYKFYDRGEQEHVRLHNCAFLCRYKCQFLPCQIAHSGFVLYMVQYSSDETKRDYRADGRSPCCLTKHFQFLPTSTRGWLLQSRNC